MGGTAEVRASPRQVSGTVAGGGRKCGSASARALCASLARCGGIAGGRETGGIGEFGGDQTWASTRLKYTAKKGPTRSQSSGSPSRI